MLVLPSKSTFRSRLVIPSEGLKYKRLSASDLTFDSGGYTTFTGVDSGTDINVELAGNLASTNLSTIAYADYDTQIPSDPTGTTNAAWLVSLYLSFDTSGFSGGEEQNLGLYFFNALPDDGPANGTGYYGGGTISVTAQPNRSIRQYDVKAKNVSALPTTGAIVNTATQMTCNILIRRYGSGGGGSSTNKIRSEFGVFSFGDASGYSATSQTDNTNYEVASGNNLHIGFWCSRATSGAFTNNFTINEFSYAILDMIP